jgi:arsenate reductase
MTSKMRLTIWHNPRCSKSRQALALLEEAGVDVNIRLYLTDPLSADEISGVLSQLGCAPREMMRTGEPVYKELGLAQADDAALLAAMVNHPILVERPIILSGTRAVIGRPPERVHEMMHEIMGQSSR